MPRKYINSFGDFFTHTRLHQKRVELLGKWLYEEHLDHFDTIPKDILSGFLGLHDQAKFLPVLRSGELTTDTYLERLYPFFGSGFEHSPPPYLTDFVNEINKLEFKIGVNYLDTHLYSDPSFQAMALEKLRLIEHIADLVDRGQCPVSREEFGYELLPASDYLNDSFSIDMAKKLERNYGKIVDPWTYESQLG